MRSGSHYYTEFAIISGEPYIGIVRPMPRLPMALLRVVTLNTSRWMGTKPRFAAEQIVKAAALQYQTEVEGSLR